MVDDWIEVADAAALLGVQPGRVRQLIGAGEIQADQRSGRWWVRADGVERLAAMQRNGRPLSPRTAWAVLARLSHELVPPLQDRRLAWRVDRYVAQLGAGSAVAQLRRRASPVVGRIHPGLLDVVRCNLVAGGAAALPSSLPERLIEDDRVEGYISQTGWESLKIDVPMSLDGRANLLVRLVEDELWPFPVGAELVPAIVAAVDLLERPDGRAARAGEAALALALKDARQRR